MAITKVQLSFEVHNKTGLPAHLSRLIELISREYNSTLVNVSMETKDKED